MRNVLRIKSNMDSGMFRPVQLAAATALGLGEEWFQGMNSIYDARRKIGLELMDRLECKVPPNQAGMFIWGKCTVDNVDEVVDDLLGRLGIFITPGHIFGEGGRRYLRLSLCSPEQVLKEALKRIEGK